MDLPSFYFFFFKKKIFNVSQIKSKQYIKKKELYSAQLNREKPFYSTVHKHKRHHSNDRVNRAPRWTPLSCFFFFSYPSQPEGNRGQPPLLLSLLGDDFESEDDEDELPALLPALRFGDFRIRPGSLPSRLRALFLLGDDAELMLPLPRRCLTGVCGAWAWLRSGVWCWRRTRVLADGCRGGRCRSNVSFVRACVFLWRPRLGGPPSSSESCSITIGSSRDEPSRRVL